MLDQIKREEVSLFERENGEYELEKRQKELRNALERKKVLQTEKELELRRLKDEAFRRETVIQQAVSRLLQQEESIDEETNTTQFCINGLKAKVADLRALQQDYLDQEAILRERLKIEGKAELGLAGFELNQSVLS